MNHVQAMQQSAAKEQTGHVDFDIPPQPVGSALIEFGRQAGISVLIEHEVRDAGTVALGGRYLPLPGLERLLSGTGLDYHATDDGVIVFQSVARPARRKQQDGPVDARHRNRQNLLARLGLALGSLLLANNANAEGPDGESAQSDVVIEEIIVSAQKRDESLQEVPIALTAFSGEYLRDAAVKDIPELIFATPGISGSMASNYFLSFSVRGISSPAYGPGVEPAVGIYTDGVYHGRFGAGISTFFDVERVEVLKGPQGLLFGRNASAGAVNTITAKPELEAAKGLVSVGVGERSRQSYEVMYNQPLSENWAMRIAAAHKEEDGYVENLFNGEDLTFQNRDAVRVSLRNENDRGDITLTTAYEDSERDGVVYISMDENGKAAYGDNRTTDTDFEGPDELEQAEASLTVNLDLTETMRLKSVTGFYKNNWHYGEDWDGSRIQLAGWDMRQENDYFSQEFVLSRDHEQFSWFAGASFYTEDLHHAFTHKTGDIGWLFGLPFPLAFDESLDLDARYQGWGLYGDARLQITDALDLSIGGRYTVDERKATLDLKGQAYFVSAYTPEPITSKQDWNDFSPRAVLRYFANDDLMFYVSASKGFKAGGFDHTTVVPHDPVTTVARPGAELLEFAAEKVWSYEVGSKASVADGRVQMDLAAFYYAYEDLQTAVVDPLGGAAAANVGEVDALGIEIETRIVFNQYSNLRLGAAWLDTEANDIPVQLCLNVQDCNGHTTTFSPEFSAAGALDLHYPMADGEVFGSVEFSWKSKEYANLDNLPKSTLDSVGFLDLRLGWKNDNWRIAAYVENVTDTEHFAFRVEGGPLFSLILNPTVPRTAGVELSYRFSNGS